MQSICITGREFYKRDAAQKWEFGMNENRVRDLYIRMQFLNRGGLGVQSPYRQDVIFLCSV